MVPPDGFEVLLGEFEVRPWRIPIALGLYQVTAFDVLLGEFDVEPGGSPNALGAYQDDFEVLRESLRFGLVELKRCATRGQGSTGRV